MKLEQKWFRQYKHFLYNMLVSIAKKSGGRGLLLLLGWGWGGVFPFFPCDLKDRTLGHCSSTRKVSRWSQMVRGGGVVVVGGER